MTVAPDMDALGIIGSPHSVDTLPPLFSFPSYEGNMMGLSEVADGFPENQETFTNTFLKSMLISMESKDPVVANAWLETLLDVIDLLPNEVVKEEIFSFALDKGQSQLIASRLGACKLIGKISTKFEPHLLKSEVLGVVQSLCQDVSGEVRESICLQLGSVARGVGLETTKASILPELVNLCSDEELNVRLAGINTIVQLIPLVDQETRGSTLVPLVKKICENAMKMEDLTLAVTAHHLGRLCHGLHDDLSEELKGWFINFFCTLAKLGLPDSKRSDHLPMPDLVAEIRSGEFEAECRHQCAYNLPAIIIFAGGSHVYRSNLLQALLSLVTDPSFVVQNTVALSFHQLCALIGGDVGVLKKAFLNLLRSECLNIIAALTPNISHILATFHHHQALMQVDQQQNEILELVGALKQAEETVSVSSSWRIHSEILRQMVALALCMPSDLLFSEVVPIMITRMHTVRPIPCRLAAARTILVYLRHMDNIDQRDHICNTLVIEFGEGKSCHKRMLFLNVCEIALDLLPKSLFKNHFFQPVMALNVDPVPNIRLKMVSLLPMLKSILDLPEDIGSLQELEMVIGNMLMNEKDRDVSAVISLVVHQLGKIVLTEVENAPTQWSEAQDNSFWKKDATVSLRSNPGSKLPFYMAAERRRSQAFSPAAPPDPEVVTSKEELIKDRDLGLLCPVLVSPEETLTSKWEGFLNLAIEGAESNFLSMTTEEEKSSVLPVLERLFMRSFNIQGKSQECKNIREVLNQIPNDSLQNGGGESSDSGYPSASLFCGKKSVISTPDAIFSKTRTLATHYVEGKPDLSSRQRFWVKSSKAQWRRKVASADTSPEEPKRNKLTRGFSLEERDSPSESDGDILFLDSPRHKGKEELMNVQNSSQPAVDDTSPPSPYGMHTWPPQHVRHRHHSSVDLTSTQNKVSETHKSYSHQKFSCDDETVTMFHLSKPPQSLKYVPHAEGEKSEILRDHRQCSSLDIYDSEVRSQKQRPYPTRRILPRSFDYADTHSKISDIPYLNTVSYSRINEFPKGVCVENTRKPGSAFHYVGRHMNPIISKEKFLPFLVAAKQMQHSNPHKLPLKHGCSEVLKGHPQKIDDDQEDLYAIHNITPTRPRISDFEPTSSFHQSFSDETYSSDVYSAPSSQKFIDSYISSHHEEWQQPQATSSSSRALDASYKEIRYHLAAAAAAAEHEWLESKRFEQQIKERNYELQRSNNLPPYIVMDSGEFAPWTSSSAYPIGPLGTSWKQHGFQSQSHSPPFYPPLLARNRSLPHAYPFYSSFSEQWHPSHISSFRSMANLDISTEEFMIDAGIRIDESSLHSSIPTASNHAVRGNINKLKQVEGPDNESASRFRPSAIMSKIPIVGKVSESARINLSKNQTPSLVRTMVPQQQVSQPSSSVLLPQSQGVDIVVSRVKSQSPENFPSSTRLIRKSSSTSVNAVCLCPSSPNDSRRRSSNFSCIRQYNTVERGNNPPSCRSSPSSSRCSSPISDERKGKSQTSSPASSQCSSPRRGRGGVDVDIASRRHSQSFIPTVIVQSKGRGSRLPLPVTKK